MKKIISLLLCVILTFGCVVSVGAYSFSNNGTATKKATAYRLPSSSSGDVWWIDTNDKLQVFCKDGDYYLVLYPFNNTGKHVLGYVPASAVKTSGVPSASSFYKNEKVRTKANANLYHNPSTDKLTGASGSNQTVRATVSKGQELTVLFEKDGFYCVRTSNDTGFIEKSKICNHSNVSDKKISSGNASNFGDKTYHKIEVLYKEVCDTCGFVIEENISKTEKEIHSLSNGKCTDCGYKETVLEEKEESKPVDDVVNCQHTTTYEVENPSLSELNGKDDNSHYFVKYVDIICIKCEKTLQKEVAKTVAENHLFNGNYCMICAYEKNSGKSAWVCNTNGAALKIHRVAALGNTIRGEIPVGAKLTVFGEKTNGFYRVEYNDIVGYVQAEYITFTEPKKESAESVKKTAYVYNTSGKLLNIRSQANKTSSVVITIAEGSSVTVTGDIINGFYPVNCEGKSGYAQADYITFKKETNGKTAWVSYAIASDLDIHRLPAIGKTIRGKIPAGAQLTVFGEKTNGFYRVEYNGVSGYAQAKYIVFSKPTEGKKAWVYNTNGAPLEVHRTSALGNTIRGEIPAKAEVTVTGNKTNGFYKVTYKDIVGYVQAEYITFTKPPEGKSAWVYNTLGESLKIHRQAALGNTTRGAIPFGHEFTVTGDRTNGFYPVYYNGIAGYVEAKYVTYDKTKAIETGYVWPVSGGYRITVLDYYYGSAKPNLSGIGPAHPVKGGKGIQGAIDIASKGNVLATSSGTVISINKGYSGGWGNNITIRHNDGTYSFYAHLANNSICVAKNQKVVAGQKVGVVGNTGNSKGVHLHFEIWNSSGKTIYTINVFKEKYRKNLTFDSDIVSGGSNNKDLINWIKNNYKLSDNKYVAK